MNLRCHSGEKSANGINTQKRDKSEYFRFFFGISMLQVNIEHISEQILTHYCM